MVKKRFKQSKISSLKPVLAFCGIIWFLFLVYTRLNFSSYIGIVGDIVIWFFLMITLLLLPITLIVVLFSPLPTYNYLIMCGNGEIHIENLQENSTTLLSLNFSIKFILDDFKMMVLLSDNSNNGSTIQFFYNKKIFKFLKSVSTNEETKLVLHRY